MSNQNIQREILQYILKLNDAEKKSVLDMIKALLKDKKGMRERISMQQYKYELDLGRYPKRRSYPKAGRDS